MKSQWIRPKMSTVLITSALSFGAPAQALPVFEPGASPCNMDCPQDWAQAQMQVPDGVLTPQEAQPGDIVIAMSYAREGEPFATFDRMVVGGEAPWPGIGYWFENEGQTYLFMRIDACGNWAVLQRQSSSGAAGAAGGAGGGGGWAGGSGGTAAGGARALAGSGLPLGIGTALGSGTGSSNSGSGNTSNTPLLDPPATS